MKLVEKLRAWISVLDTCCWSYSVRLPRPRDTGIRGSLNLEPLGKFAPPTLFLSVALHMGNCKFRNTKQEGNPLTAKAGVYKKG